MAKTPDAATDVATDVHAARGVPLTHPLTVAGRGGDVLSALLRQTLLQEPRSRAKTHPVEHLLKVRL